MMNMKDYSRIKEIIENADAILIGAGAGLSTSAGIDYSRESFRNKFPELVKNYGMTDMYISSFYEFKTEEERWSYWAKHINYSFIAPPALKTYKNLYEIVRDRNYFVITTNVDGQFLKSGFDKERVFEVQGSYGKMQCALGCHNKLYDDTRLVKKMLKSKNKLKIDTSLVPVCPVCQGKMDINIRKDAFFVENDNWHNLNRTYQQFINDNLDKKIVLLEFGVGFNTPSIIRFSFEQLANEYDKAILIRINDKYLETYDKGLKNNFIGIKEDCSHAIDKILEAK